MKFAAQGSFRRARLSALVACWLLAFAATPASGVVTRLALAPVQVDPALAPIAKGFDRWLESALQTAGRDLVLLPTGGTVAIGAAAQQGASQVLLARLIEQNGASSCVSPSTKQSRATSWRRAAKARRSTRWARRARARSWRFHRRSASAPTRRLRQWSSSRAGALDRAPARAPAARMALGAGQAGAGRNARTRGDRRARAKGRRSADRAPRVLAASGDPIAAWALVGSDAQRAVAERAPDPALLLAAAEVQLALGNPQLALRFLTAAEPLAPNSGDLHVALARAKLASGDRDGARAAARRAGAIHPDDPQPADLLIEIDANRPAELAADWLDAGARAARGLDPDLARRHWQRAADLDSKLTRTSALQLGDLEARLGRPVEALAAYRTAQSTGRVARAARGDRPRAARDWRCDRCRALAARRRPAGSAPRSRAHRARCAAHRRQSTGRGSAALAHGARDPQGRPHNNLMLGARCG